MDDPERYHLTLTAAGRPVAHGWWPDETIARGKFLSWVGKYGAIPSAQFTLVDEIEALTLAVWPDQAQPASPPTPSAARPLHRLSERHRKQR
ncbi:hypothetical protein OG870_27850 [Streptomyces sp. NBC_00461]|uniref:hypothetical protein n=1 Tax=Streptomyces sp. NBC_00461 TaxID=2975750 RepID=UPI002E16FCB3